MNVLLAESWARNKHDVCIGSRSVERARAVATGFKSNVAVGDYNGAARFGDAVLFAVEPEIAVHTASDLREALSGKVLIDANSPHGHGSRNYPAVTGTSLAERIAEVVPEARVVKAFNVIRAHTLRMVLLKRLSKLRGQYFSVFHCGDDDEARRTVSGLIGELFLDPVDCGGLVHAYQLEALAGLSMFLAEQRFGVDFAINVTRKRESSPLDAWM